MPRRLGPPLFAVALLALAPLAVRADEVDDQYAAAAGLYAKQSWQEAAQAFATFIEAHPDHARTTTATFYLAESQVQLGQYTAARTQFEAVVKREPDGKFARQAQFRQGECSYLAGDAAAAERELAAFCTAHPNDELLAYALPYRGELALTAGDKAASKQHFEEALRRFPAGAMQDDCRFGLARIAEAEGRHLEAAELYENVAAKTANPLADEAQFQAGASRYAVKDYAGADRAFATLVEKFPESPLVERARLARGWSLYHLEKYGEARELFASLIDHDEMGVQARYWLGLTHRAERNWTEAAEVLTAAADRSPQHDLTPAMLYHAGDALLQAEKNDEAADVLQKVVDGWPDSTWRIESQAGLMRVALARGDHEAVDRLAKELADQQGASPELIAAARRSQASSQLARKQYAEAATTIESLIARPPASDGEGDDAAEKAELAASDRYNLALAYQGLDRTDKALAVLATVLTATDKELLGQARFLQASLLFADGRYAEALAPLEKQLADKDTDTQRASCLAQLAVCQARLNRIADARESLAKLKNEKPAADLLWPTVRQLAEAATAAGDPQWAADLCRELAAEGVPEEYAAVGLSSLGWQHYQAGELAEAEATFGQLLTRFPTNALVPPAALARAQALEALDRQGEALAMCKLVIDTHPTSAELPDALLRGARLHLRMQQPAESLALYERLERDFPQNEQADAVLYEAAWLLRGQGRLDEADARFVRLRQGFPQSRFWADATYRLAERAHQQQDFDGAGELLRELLAAGPQRPVLEHALYLQGQVAAGQDRWDDVERSMGQLMTSAPDAALAPLAEFWVAEAAYRRNEFETAGERFAALGRKVEGRREPWVAMVVLRQGQVLAQQNHWAEAEQVAEKVLKDWPQLDERFEVEYLLGRALANRGEFEAAREAYRGVIRSETGGKTETAAMAQWMIGESYFHQKNYDTALREYLRLEILYAYPTWQAGALLQAGKCHEQLGEWKEASELYARLLQNYGQTRFAEEAAGRLRTARTQN